MLVLRARDRDEGTVSRSPDGGSHGLHHKRTQLIRDRVIDLALRFAAGSCVPCQWLRGLCKAKTTQSLSPAFHLIAGRRRRERRAHVFHAQTDVDRQIRRRVTIAIDLLRKSRLGRWRPLMVRVQIQSPPHSSGNAGSEDCRTEIVRSAPQANPPPDCRSIMRARSAPPLG